MRELADAYTIAKNLQARRVISRSDEIENRGMDDKIKRLAMDIENLEKILGSYQQTARFAAKKLELDNEVLRVIPELSGYKFIAGFGDYLAILNHDSKDHALLTRFAFTNSFVDTTCNLMKKIDAEIVKKEFNPATPTPIIDSIQKASTLVPHLLRDGDEIIAVLRSYAERNIHFNTGAKDEAEQGKMVQLRKRLINDWEQLDYAEICSGLSKEEIADGRNILTLMKELFFKRLEWDAEDADYELTELGRERNREWLRKKGEKKLAQERQEEAGLVAVGPAY